MSDRVLIVNGPNLNLLAIREPEIYGSKSLADLEQELMELAGQLNINAEFFQSNHEGDLVDRIQQAYRENVGVLIINAGALTHYSIALHDVLKAVAIPVIEVHMSNIYKREWFRHESLISPVAVGGIYGFGFLSYRLAMMAAADLLNIPG